MANNQIRSGVACGAAVVGILNLVCGLAEAITGLVFIALPGVSSSFAFGWGRSFYGVWSGLGLIACGILGVALLFRRKHALLIAFLAMVTVMIVISFLQLILAVVSFVAVGISDSEKECHLRDERCFCVTGREPTSTENARCDLVLRSNRVFLTILIISVFATLFCVIASILSCVQLCCTREATQHDAVTMETPGPGDSHLQVEKSN